MDEILLAIGGVQEKMDIFCEKARLCTLFADFETSEPFDDYVIKYFHDENIYWRGDLEKSWEQLMALAESLTLSWRFIKIGNEIDDAFYEGLWEDGGNDSELIEAFYVKQEVGFTYG